MPVIAKKKKGTLLFQCVSLSVTGYMNLIGKVIWHWSTEHFPHRKSMFTVGCHPLQCLCLDHSLRQHPCFHLQAAMGAWYMWKLW